MMKQLNLLWIACLTIGLITLPGLFSAFAGSPALRSRSANAAPASIIPYAPNFAIGWIVAAGFSDGYGLIYKTQDGGRRWARQGSAATIPAAPLYGVYASDSRNVWVTGGNIDGYGLILRTSDGGATWVRQGSTQQVPNVEMHRVFAIDPQTAWASGDQGVMLYTGDGGQTWTRKGQSTLPAIHLEGIYASDATHAWVVGTDEPNGLTGMIFYTSDGGQTWVKQFETLGNWLISMHGSGGSQVWAVGHNTIVHTANGGQDWQDQTPGSLKAGIDSNGVFALDANRVWVVSDFDGIFLSTNGGAEWTQKKNISAVGFYLFRISALDARSAWTVGPSDNPRPVPGAPVGVILRSTDGGESWIEQHALTDESWSGVAFTPGWGYYFPWVTK